MKKCDECEDLNYIGLCPNCNFKLYECEIDGKLLTEVQIKDKVCDKE